MAEGKTVEIDLGQDEAEWFKEFDGKRLRLLGRLVGVPAEVSDSDEARKLTFAFKDDPQEDVVHWAQHCVKAALAMKHGETLEAPALPEQVGDTALPVKVMSIPKDAAKNFVLGKGGARLQDISEELQVIVVFVQEVKPVEKKEFVLEAGILIEAKYEGGERWFEAKVEEVGEDTVKIKWTHDDELPPSDVSKSDIRELPAKAEPMDEDPGDQPLEVGTLVDAKFDGGDRVFEAKVIKIDGSKVTVKWTYDDAVPESEVNESDIKCRPKPVMAQLHIYGYDRGLLEAELKVIQCVETKSPGFGHANASPTQDDDERVGLAIVPLLDNGALKAKCIGQSGSMRKKIGTTCGSALEYIGNDAFIVGTLSERKQTAALLNLVQVQSNGEVSEIPEILEDICSRVAVPSSSSSNVMGSKRANMNKVEIETKTLSFWVPTATVEKDAEEPKSEFTPEVGEIYEARFAHKNGDRWFEAKVLEEIKGEDGASKYKVEWQYDPDQEKSELPAGDLRKVGSAPPAKPVVSDRTLAIFGADAARKAASTMVQDLIDGKDPWPAPKRENDYSADTWEPPPKKPKVVYVVNADEEERRRKRAARFA